MSRVKLYWFRSKRGIDVTVQALTLHSFVWTHIYGLQIGPWFVGTIRGTEYAQRRHVPGNSHYATTSLSAPKGDVA